MNWEGLRSTVIQIGVIAFPTDMSTLLSVNEVSSFVGVLTILRNLNTIKSTGSEKNPCNSLNNCANSLSNLLRKLFHLSFIYGKYLKLWKLNNV